MPSTEELLDDDLATASRAFANLIPDVVAVFDQVVPLIINGTDRTMMRRYFASVDAATHELSNLSSSGSEAFPSSTVLFQILRGGSVELPWVAQSPDGIGVITALVEKWRGLVAGVPQEIVQIQSHIEERQFNMLVKAHREFTREQEQATPLRRVMATLNLSTTDIANLMGVTRQAVDKWLVVGPPKERLDKIGAMVEISEILGLRLREGLPAVVARRKADAYGGRTMLELIADDEHDWLLESIKNSFNFVQVA